MSTPSYGAEVSWEPVQARGCDPCRLLRLLGDRRRFAVRRRRAAAGGGARPAGRSFRDRRRDRSHQCGPPPRRRGATAAVHAGARLRARAAAGRDRTGDRGRRAPQLHHRGLVRRRAARGARDGRRLDRAAGRDRHERRRRILPARDQADRTPPGRAGPHRRPRDPLSGDRRARVAGAAPCDARRERAHDGAMDRGGRLPPRGMGAGPLLADRRQPGRASCSGPTRASPHSGGWRRRRER